MNKRWTLHIERMAKIESADVKISPLMCFVGDNNTGKSYIMSLLWGILTLGKNIFPKTVSDTKSYKICESWLRENIGRNSEFNDEIINCYIAWFNDLLAFNKRTLLRKIFNYDIEAGKIEIREYIRAEKLSLKWEKGLLRYSVGHDYIKFPLQESPSREQLLRMNSYICWNILMEGIAAPLFSPAIRGRRMGEPVYLPASRTGFMLTYSQLVESSLQSSFSPEEHNASSLTLPYIDFLQLITKFEAKAKPNKRSQWAAEFIEKYMSYGKLIVMKDTLPVIEYKPEGKAKQIPLYVASSIITELSPLLLLFRSDIDFRSLIIEEPEAHLHPLLQKRIARLIINLVNRGIPVWITTHSDTILQHINNMIMLKNNLASKDLSAKYRYTSEDMLDKQDVSMYQFDSQSSAITRIKKLEAGENGFVVSTFNDALEEIVDEVYSFQDNEI